MWDLIVSVPDHCLSFYFGHFYLVSCTRIHQFTIYSTAKERNAQTNEIRIDPTIAEEVSQ